MTKKEIKTQGLTYSEMNFCLDAMMDYERAWKLLDNLQRKANAEQLKALEVFVKARDDEDE